MSSLQNNLLTIKKKSSVLNLHKVYPEQAVSKRSFDDQEGISGVKTWTKSIQNEQSPEWSFDDQEGISSVKTCTKSIQKNESFDDQEQIFSVKLTQNLSKIIFWRYFNVQRKCSEKTNIVLELCTLFPLNVFILSSKKYYIKWFMVGIYWQDWASTHFGPKPSPF